MVDKTGGDYMTMAKFVKSKGLTVAIVANQMGVSRQALSLYGHGRNPRATTLLRVVKAMNELGVPTTMPELVSALYTEELDAL